MNDVWVKPNMLVDSAGIYFLRAHEVYKRKVKDKQIGDEKGDPFIRTTKTIQNLRAFRKEISSQLSAMLKDWYYPNTSSCSFCAYKSHCVARHEKVDAKEIDGAHALLAELNMVD